MRIRFPPGVRQQIAAELINQPSPTATRKLQKALDDALSQIELFPESSRRHSPPRDDMRIIFVGRYRLLYMIDEEEDEILLVSFVPAVLPGDALG